MMVRFNSIVSMLALVLAVTLRTQGAPTHLVDEEPASITRDKSGVIMVDFGRAAFGNIRLMPPAGEKGSVVVHFGESLADGRINRMPPGTVRYSKASVVLNGKSSVVAAPPPDRRNTEQANPNHPPAISTPAEWGVVLPFRWVEIEGWDGELLPEHITRQTAYSATWEDDAADFESSDEMLNQIWDLCRYSIKATTFAGVYVDGDRERIPYEADAYINQLSHYYTDNDIQMARDTIDHLLEYGTWPTEWAPHMVFMVHADWMHTGDKQWMARRYETLKKKTLIDRMAPDGLIGSNEQQIKRTDIVDWPSQERDGYVFTSRNTVVNAFHLRAMVLMGEMARALGKNDEASEFGVSARATHEKFQQTFFDTDKGLYRDGMGTDHIALHANLFPLAFDLVRKDDRAKLADWLANRGMKCSVYAAQYLMEGLFENGAEEEAIELICARNDRSWRHMVESGTTITWEAWDQKYKPNQDWNHAWGAAPANLLPRFVLGAQPLTPGWKRARIAPRGGSLTFAKGKVPTPLGPILIDWKYDTTFTLLLELPEGMKAHVELPVTGPSKGVFCRGKSLNATRVDDHWVLEKEVEGSIILEVK